MGNTCMSGNTLVGEQQLKDQIVLNKDQATKKLSRNGLPSDVIGISTREINIKVKDPARRSEINEMIFKVLEEEKQFREPIKVNVRERAENKLEQTYYLPTINGFYVGEWVYNNQINDNVPGGVGRLYEKQTVSEGEFFTQFIDYEFEEDELQMKFIAKNPKLLAVSTLGKMLKGRNLQKLAKGQKKHSLQIPEIPERIVEQSMEDSNMIRKKDDSEDSEAGLPDEAREYEFQEEVDRLERQRLEREKYEQLKAKKQEEESLFGKNEKKKIKSCNYIVRLNGRGRINSKQIGPGRKKQIIFDGEFSEGVLDGKGKLRVLVNDEEIYFYDGDWKMGCKNGKGYEKGKSYEYEGRYVQNQKHGKGKLNYYKSQKEKHSIEADISRFELMKKQDGADMNISIRKKIKIKEHREKLLNQILPKQLPCQHLQVSFMRTLISDLTFGLEREFRKVFAERYDGDFQHNKMEGKGLYFWNTGKAYLGQWKNDQMEGLGEFHWIDGSFYQGNYSKDERSGEGIMVWNYYRRYRGNFAFGMRHGYGESIQINEEDEQNQNRQGIRVTISGALWLQDKVEKKIFSKQFQIDRKQYLNIKHLQKEAMAEETGGQVQDSDSDDQQKKKKEEKK